MKAVFLTNSPNAPCSVFYSDAFKSCEHIEIYDTNIEKYDVILLMTYDHELVLPIKKTYPKKKVGLIDPRSHEVFPNAVNADFLIVDSIEMEDYWRAAQRPIFRYVEYPRIHHKEIDLEKYRKKLDKVSIGYHGNTVHLECMSETVTPAIESIASKYDVELVLMHNGSAPEGKEPWLPKGVSIKHIKWSIEGYEDISNCDIGIVPNNILQNPITKSASASGMPKKFNYKDDDYVIRFKMPSNPGRMVVFGLLGVPVIADFYPSAHELLAGCDHYHKRGLVANSSAGWKYSLEYLVKNRDESLRMAKSFQDYALEHLSFQAQNEKLVIFLKNIIQDVT